MPAEEVDRDRLALLDLVSIDSPTGHEEEIGKELAAVHRLRLHRHQG